ncbi:hypothetical protein Goari_000831, partial [Gossypium aridum]|nr:hypothetical protein [Gossypium aridum]
GDLRHTFHLPCNECTITLKNAALQFGLLVDGQIVTGSVVVGSWSGICEQLLGKLSNKFFGSQIEMKWLEDNFGYLDDTSNALEKEKHAREFILRLVNDVLMPDKSQNLFEWMSYANLRIRACIPAEYLANPKIWHMKVPLIVYAKVEMHESDRVDLRGRIDEDWPTFHGQYINIWQSLSTTCHGLDIMTNHIFYLRRQGLGNVVLGGQDYKTPNPYPSPE